MQVDPRLEHRQHPAVPRREAIPRRRHGVAGRPRRSERHVRPHLGGERRIGEDPAQVGHDPVGTRPLRDVEDVAEAVPLLEEQDAVAVHGEVGDRRAVGTGERLAHVRRHAVRRELDERHARRRPAGVADRELVGRRERGHGQGERTAQPWVRPGTPRIGRLHVLVHDPGVPGVEVGQDRILDDRADRHVDEVRPAQRHRQRVEAREREELARQQHESRGAADPKESVRRVALIDGGHACGARDGVRLIRGDAVGHEGCVVAVAASGAAGVDEHPTRHVGEAARGRRCVGRQQDPATRQRQVVAEVEAAVPGGVGPREIDGQFLARDRAGRRHGR